MTQARPSIASVVVVPVRGRPVIGGAGSHLLAAVRRLAANLTRESVRLVAVDLGARALWCADTGERVAPSALLGSWATVLMNPAFLLADAPPVPALLDVMAAHGIAWCASRSTRDVYAVAIGRPRWQGPPRLWPALRLVAAGLNGAGDDAWSRITGQVMLPPATAWPEHSPAMAGVERARGRRAFDAPPFVNTAFAELLGEPADPGARDGTPRRLLDALLAQRERSRVPWIWNALAVEIEHRLGEPRPRAVPPEVHLSVTGRCNIECRFCAYEHALARRDRVDVERVARLDFLGLAQTFRLHSGLGEPTTNPHLPAIVEHVARHFPHVGMNFFTNGLALGRERLLDALVGRVRWINVSLNAAGRETWRALCGVDAFDRVAESVRALHTAKHASRSLHPLAFGSMVLTAANVDELPRMPALCRELGIDRFTAFPYFGLGYHGQDKYGPEMTLAACRDRYDALYEVTVREAEAHRVSLEIPAPAAERRTRFGMEARPLHDFARIESNEGRLGRFVADLAYDTEPGAHCAFLWRTACIGSTNDAGHAGDETHYLYPCIGPLSGVDLSRQTAFRFPGRDDFLQLWSHPVLTRLRRAQREPGVSPVCDACRATDTRDPRHFADLERLVAEFAREHTPQAGGGISR